MIRTATRTDIPEIVDLGERHLRASHYARHIEPDRAAMAALARMLIDEAHGLVLVAEQAGRVIGHIGVVATLHPYSGLPVMSEMFWYVAPEARGAGVRLLKCAEDWARANGIAHALMVAPDERVAGLYRRLGYAPLETQFIKAL